MPACTCIVDKSTEALDKHRIDIATFIKAAAQNKNIKDDAMTRQLPTHDKQDDKYDTLNSCNTLQPVEAGMYAGKQKQQLKLDKKLGLVSALSLSLALSLGLCTTASAVTKSAQSHKASHAKFEGLYFDHQDWEVACDNSGTCRMAGYQADWSDGGEEMATPVSILLERAAGVNTPVTGWVQLGSYDDDSVVDISPAGLKMLINDKPLGAVDDYDDEQGGYRLRESQVKSLLAALSKDSHIEFRYGQQRWQVSDDGAMAVMLKADEYQGRVGSASALATTSYKAGAVLDSSAYAPVALPTITIGHIETGAALLPAYHSHLADVESRLYSIVESTLSQDPDDYDNRCDGIQERDKELWQDRDISWQVMKLNEHKSVITHLCWRAAYNEGTGIWLINNSEPYQPERITLSASDVSKDAIYAAHKGRGLGDCWSMQEWVWDGKTYQRSYEGTTGLCRLVAAGGAWRLPVYQTRVVDNQGRVQAAF